MPCTPGEIGEIHLRGRNVMRGICGRTRDMTFDADGFYATGDLGALDADGYLWFHGRRDDMFKVKGATVYPAEVEAALRAIDGVRQAHVTNVPDSSQGEAVGALVVSAAPVDDLIAAARAASERVQGADALGRDGLGRRRPDDRRPRRSTRPRLQELLATRGDRAMTRAIDGLVNVDFADREMPDWMVRVKEDYFKGDDSFFKSPELSELLDDMDANGVERAILMTNVHATEGRALVVRRSAARPVRARGRRLQPAEADEDGARAGVVRPQPPGRVRDRRPELLGRRHVPADRSRLLPALHEVLRARPAAVHEHGHPRSAAARRAAEPDPSRPGVLPLPRAEALHDPRRRPVVGHRDPADDQVPEPAADDLGVVAEAPAGVAAALHVDARQGPHHVRVRLPGAVDGAMPRRGRQPRPRPTRCGRRWLYDNADAFFFGGK